MVEYSIGLIVTAVSFVLEMFKQLLDATGTTELWIAGITFAFFVSIVLMPFRGGNPIGSGGFVGFLANRVNSHKKSGSKSKHDD